VCIKGHEDCFHHHHHPGCTDPDKNISLVYTKTKTMKPGMGTINGKHVYELPQFEPPKFVWLIRVWVKCACVVRVYWTT
jgi:hypothetical protein